MPRRKTQFARDQYYHIYNRGCNRENIFNSDENYRFFLRKAKKYFQEYNIDVIAYCLMPNHFHFLLRQNGETSLSECIQKIFLSYTKAFNKMYNRSGTLFEDRFKSIHVADEGYILHLCRYIHRNPLEAHLVKDVTKWEFSNYLEWINRRKGSLVDREFIEGRFSNSIEYKQFVLNYTPPEKIQKGLKKYFFD